MKQVVVLLCLISFSFTALYAEIDERKIDLYYANGMMGDSKKSEEKVWAEYVKSLKKLNPNLKAGTTNVKVAYNASGLWGLDDAVEVIYQKAGDLISWAKMQESLREYVADNKLIESFNAKSQLFNYEDLKVQIDSYKKDISDGHSVVVVAHSQNKRIKE